MGAGLGPPFLRIDNRHDLSQIFVMASKRYSKRRVANALRQAQGNVTKAAQVLQCDRQTVHRYLNRYPDLRLVLDEAPRRGRRGYRRPV